MPDDQNVNLNADPNDPNAPRSETRISDAERMKSETIMDRIDDAKREAGEKMGEALVSLEVALQPHGLTVVDLLKSVARSIHGVHLDTVAK